MICCFVISKLQFVFMQTSLEQHDPSFTLKWLLWCQEGKKSLLLFSFIGSLGFSIFMEGVFYELPEDIFSLINGESTLQWWSFGEQSPKGIQVVQKILKSMNSSSEHTRGAIFCLYMVCFAQKGYIWSVAKARERKTLDECQNFISGRFGLREGGIALESKLCCLKSSGHWKIREMGC